VAAIVGIIGRNGRRSNRIVVDVDHSARRVGTDREPALHATRQRQTGDRGDHPQNSA
jgi:hypothetical protein